MANFSTLAQLRQMSWPTREAAVAELKRNGLKQRGADYEVRMYKEGSWQIMPLEDDAGTVNFAAKSNKDDPTKPDDKPGKKDHPADADAKTKIANAESYTIHFRASPTKRYDETAATLDEAIAQAQAMNAAHGKHGRRATIFAIPKGKGAGVPVPYDHSVPKPQTPQGATGKGAQGAGKTNGGDAPPAASPSPATAPETTGNDLSPLPTEGGPYVFRVPIGPQFKLAEIAERMAMKIDHMIEIVSVKTGKIVRTIDPRLATGERPKRAARVTGPRGPRGEGKQAKAIGLLTREKGATKKELADATGWPIAQRHINRLAKVSRKTAKTLGNDRWALV
jgi:hypothetical protein